MKATLNNTKRIVNDRIYYLNHEVRRPLSNIISISELIVSPVLSEDEKQQISHGLQAALEDFDRVLIEFGHMLNNNAA